MVAGLFQVICNPLRCVLDIILHPSKLASGSTYDGEERRGEERRGKERKGEKRRGEERRGEECVKRPAVLPATTTT
jgi:hypothetical protein